jgi:quercetin dioxygenase-like cupin family protein
MRVLAFPVCLLLVATPVLQSQAAPTPKHKTVFHWSPAPAVFPKGAKMAVLSGDPNKAAPFTVALALPRGYKIPPHFHPTTETVTVTEGTFLVGMGDTFDASKVKVMKAGESTTVPAQAHHFAAASGPTIITVSAMGPFAMTYVNAADDPQTHAAKP